MSPLHLVIPNPALREAVVEQLALAHMGAVREHADVSSALAEDSAHAVLIADEEAFDKKAQETLRARNVNMSILLLGAPPDEAAGVTESFPKPLRLGHLLARVKFHQDTAPKLRATPVTFGAFRLEPQNRHVVETGTGAIIRLTEKETALLEYLGHNGRPVPREELLTVIWGYDARIDTHTLETHIYHLRRKLDPAGGGQALLINEKDGYRLSASGIRT